MGTRPANKMVITTNTKPFVVIEGWGNNSYIARVCTPGVVWYDDGDHRRVTPDQAGIYKTNTFRTLERARKWGKKHLDKVNKILYHEHYREEIRG